MNAKYIDATNNVVTAKKLNLRGGPGENYSVLGVIEKGAAVTTVTTKGDWMQIRTADQRLCLRRRQVFEAGSRHGNQCADAAVAASVKTFRRPRRRHRAADANDGCRGAAHCPARRDSAAGEPPLPPAARRSGNARRHSAPPGQRRP